MNVGFALSMFTSALSFNCYSKHINVIFPTAMKSRSRRCLTSLQADIPDGSVLPNTSNGENDKKSRRSALDFLDDDASATLSRLTMSPERYADSLQLTTQQVNDAIEARKAAGSGIGKRLATLENEYSSVVSAGELGRMKHGMICRHRYDHMRKPFVCRKCWTDFPICVCPLFPVKIIMSANQPATDDDVEKEHKALLPKGIERVVVWTHHDEWGRTANTGSLLPLGLERTQMLMKGLDEHDVIMDEILHLNDVIPVVLWPGKGNDEDFRTISLPELRSIVGGGGDGGGDLDNHDAYERNDTTKPNNIQDSQRCVLISIEGTWNNARKMANKLPSKVLRLDLRKEIAASFSSSTKYDGIFFDPDYDTNADPASSSFCSPSLLAPLRRQGRGNTHNRGKMENVSTLEATLVALVGMGLSNKEAGRILWIARTKVDRILEYSGKYHAKNWK